MNNKVLNVNEHGAYLPPYHINCRCVVVRLPEGVVPVDFDPEDEQVRRNLPKAHFVTDIIERKEVRYEALKIPARVEGRDFIFRRKKDKATGRWVSQLTFRPPPDRNIPSLFLQGLMPPRGERPFISLTQLGRTIRQLPAEVWRLTDELPRAFSPSSIVIPPLDSELARQLQRGNVPFKIYPENLLVFNPRHLKEVAIGVSDDERVIATLKEIFRPILPTVVEASEKYQVPFRLLLPKVATVPKSAPTMTDVIKRRLDRVFERIEENAEYQIKEGDLRGISREVIERKAEQIKNSKITINLQLRDVIDREDPHSISVAESLFIDGRYMNKFEIEERKEIQRGTTFPSDLRVQENLFDIPLDAQPSERPVYGAVNVLNKIHGAAPRYGYSHFILKDEVKERATIFRENTFEKFDISDRKSVASFKNPINAIPDRFTREPPLIISYIEAHIFGGVSLRDVEALVISEVDIRYAPRRDIPEDILRLAALIEALGGKVYFSTLSEILPEEAGVPWEWFR